MKQINSNIPLSFNVLLALVLILVSGCDDRAIQPLEENSGTYSIYGALSLNETPNYVRIRDVTTPFFSDPDEGFNATVTFEDLGTGATTVLQDTVVNFGGNFVHNFKIEQPILPQKEYKLTVTGESGQTASSTVETPQITNLEIIPTPGTVDYFCETQITFLFRNVVEPEDVFLEVGFTDNDGVLLWNKVNIVDKPEHVPGRDEMRLIISPRQLMVAVFPPSAIDNPSINPRTLFPSVSCTTLENTTMRFRYTHFSKEWHPIRYPDGPLDPLSSPMVENGLGIFGAVLEDSFTLPLTNATNN